VVIGCRGLDYLGVCGLISGNAQETLSRILCLECAREYYELSTDSLVVNRNSLAISLDLNIKLKLPGL